MLENAAEPVPAGVWSAVSGALARKERRAGILLLMRRLSVAVAAAAAVVTAGIFLFGGLSDDELTVIASQPVAAVTPVEEASADEAVVEEIAVAETPEAATSALAVVPAAKQAPAAVSAQETVALPAAEEALEVAPAPLAETLVIEPASAEPATEPVTEPTVESSVSEVEPSATFDLSNPAADLLLADAASPRSLRSGASRLSLQAGGHLESNISPVQSTFSGRRRAGQAPSRTTGITDAPLQSSYSLPLSFGLGVNWHFADRWAVGTGLTYTYLGRSFTGTYTEAENGVVISRVTGEIHNSLHYLGVPLNLSYTFLDSRNLQCYAFAEGALEKAVANRYRIEGPDGDIWYRPSVKGVQYSFGGGFGVRFRLTETLGIYLNPSLRYYPKCDQPTSIRTQEPLMFSVEAGLRFDL